MFRSAVVLITNSLYSRLYGVRCFLGFCLVFSVGPMSSYAGVAGNGFVLVLAEVVSCLKLLTPMVCFW